MRELTLLTYNLWHGLSGEGTLRFGELEPLEHRLEREQAQEHFFSSQHADVYFFQETNPLDVRMSRFAKILSAVPFGQIDSSGLRLESAGLPLNLYSGLTTYVSPELQAIHREGLRLSGSSIQNAWFSLQLKESRYALLTECLHPSIGRMLLVNLHLHHGLERTRGLTVKVLEWKRKFNPSDRVMSVIEAKLNSGDRRRRDEIATLLKSLAGLKNRYHVIAMAGDFNASPESEIHRSLRDAGFADLWLKAAGEHKVKGGASVNEGRQGEQLSFSGGNDGVENGHESVVNEGNDGKSAPIGTTYDGVQNINHRFNAKFKLPENWDDIDMPLLAKDEFRKIILDQEALPRRIDYLYVKSTVPFHVKSMEVLGPHADVELSDHFGLKAKISFRV